MKQFFRQPMTSKIAIAKNRLDAFGRAAADEPDPAVPDGNPPKKGPDGLFCGCILCRRQDACPLGVKS